MVLLVVGWKIEAPTKSSSTGREGSVPTRRRLHMRVSTSDTIFHNRMRVDNMGRSSYQHSKRMENITMQNESTAWL